MALYPEILAEVKRVVEADVKTAVENIALEKIKDHLGTTKCLRVGFDGTATIKAAGTNVEFDWINKSGETVGHASDLETEEFINIWKTGAGGSLAAFRVTTGDGYIFSTFRSRCHSARLEPATVRREITLTVKKDRYLLKDFSYTHDGTALVEHLQAEEDSTIAFEIDIVVNIETSSCEGLSMLETPNEEQTALALAEVITGVQTSLAEAGPSIFLAITGAQSLTAGLGRSDWMGSAEAVATALAPKLRKDIRLDVDLLPPSIGFGNGEDEVRVSPTVGGSNNPDAIGSVGLQVDINPKGGGRRPIGRLDVAVDLDERGRACGGSIGWRCRF